MGGMVWDGFGWLCSASSKAEGMVCLRRVMLRAGCDCFDWC